MFQPEQRNKIIANSFPSLKLGEHDTQFVSEFKYLEHLVNSYSDAINREIRHLFMRTNVLIRRFSKIVQCQCSGYYSNRIV